MKNSPTLTAFEHQNLTVGHRYGGVTFGPTQWDSLVRLHPTLPAPYYALTHRGVRLSHYVGMLKTPQLTLEILPKTDASATDASAADTSATHWRAVLVDLLAECGYLRVHRSSALLSVQRAGQWFDGFLLDFLSAVAQLCRRGLVKQYATATGQQRALRGQLRFAEQIRYNVAHQERFYVRHQTYHKQHNLHRLLKQALQVVERLSTHPIVRQQTRRLLAYFADVPGSYDVSRELPPTFDRRTETYRTAATVAYQILSAQRSHLYQGKVQLGFAMLLDMNLLFEEFVYRRLHRLSATRNFTVHRQVSRLLWGQTKVRPDLLITQADSPPIIVDTKWKVLARARPAAEDLHQLYVYNQLFGARKGVLLYPQVHDLSAQRKRFDGPGHSFAEISFLKISDTSQTGLLPYVDRQLLRLIDR